MTTDTGSTLQERLAAANARHRAALIAALRVHGWPPNPDCHEWVELRQARDHLWELEDELARTAKERELEFTKK